MRRYRSFIAEASFMKNDYVIGHKVMFTGKNFKELSDLGYNKGDVFEIVAPPPEIWEYQRGCRQPVLL